MPEPDLDRGDVDGALEDELAFVGAHRDCPEVLELVDRPFDGVALLVGLAVKHWWPSTGRALGEAGLLLIGLLRDRRLDPASPQVKAGLAVGVRLVGQQPIGSGPRATGAGPGDRQPPHQGLERQAVMSLCRGAQPHQGPASSVGQQANLGAQPTPGAAERLTVDGPGRRRIEVLVIRPSPLCAPAAPAAAAPASPPARPWADRAARRPRAGAPGPRSSPLRPPTLRRRHGRCRPATAPGPFPRCHRLTGAEAPRAGP